MEVAQEIGSEVWSALAYETSLFHRILYKNFNQHRGTQYFQAIQKVSCTCHYRLHLLQIIQSSACAICKYLNSVVKKIRWPCHAHYSSGPVKRQ